MRFHPEIKEFTKNTLILTLFFTLVLHLSWGYVAPYLGLGVSAWNDATFKQTNTIYLGNIATAVSLNIWQKVKQTEKTPVNLANDVISVAELLSNPTDGPKRLIASNMLALESYANLLSTDIVALLDQSTDRTQALDEHIELLKSFYTRTSDRLSTINEQISDLNTILQTSSDTTANAKNTMEEKYKNFDVQNIDTVIDSYVTAKNNENRAKVYLTYLDRFQKGYGILQARNKVILDTLINNREAIIKHSTVIIPDSGSNLLKSMGLIKTEAEYKSTKQ